MSMLTYVFFAGPLPTPVAVTQSMQRLGLNFAISDPQQGEFTPMTYHEGADTFETGVAIFEGSTAQTIDDLGIEGIDPKLKNMISFCWSTDLREGACAQALAAAIATLTGGVIWVDSAREIISVESAVGACHGLIAVALDEVDELIDEDSAPT